MNVTYACRFDTSPMNLLYVHWWCVKPTNVRGQGICEVTRLCSSVMWPSTNIRRFRNCLPLFFSFIPPFISIAHLLPFSAVATTISTAHRPRHWGSHHHLPPAPPPRRPSAASGPHRHPDPDATSTRLDATTSSLLDAATGLRRRWPPPTTAMSIWVKFVNCSGPPLHDKFEWN
jgi:hypothetical protein